MELVTAQKQPHSDFTILPAVELLNYKRSCNAVGDFFPELGFSVVFLYISLREKEQSHDGKVGGNAAACFAYY
jgi:hypothetical protein